ncbi:uncharacterized protein LOC144328374, partial [Podarcis muralis]
GGVWRAPVFSSTWAWAGPGHPGSDLGLHPRLPPRTQAPLWARGRPRRGRPGTGWGCEAAPLRGSFSRRRPPAKESESGARSKRAPSTCRDPKRRPVAGRGGRKAGRQSDEKRATVLPPRLSRVLRRAGPAMGENNLKRCQGEAEQVTEIMLENYSKVLDREGKLSELDQRAAELRNQSVAFSKTTGTVARKMRWKNMKWKVILVGVVAGVLILILAIVLYFTLPSSANMDTPAKGDGGP